MRLFGRDSRESGPTAGRDRDDERSFATEALPHLDVVYRFALRLCRGVESEAEDLVQDAFSRAYKSWHTYQPGTRCRSWLFTICRNEFLKRRAREDRIPEVLTSDIDADLESVAATDVFNAIKAADPERAFFDSFIDAEVVAAIDRIPDFFREALVLSDLEGLSYPDISEILEVPVGTVKSRIFRARRMLQESLYEYAREMGYIRSRDES